MQDNHFIEYTSTRMNPHVDPVLHIWGWEVPVYLFLGGLVAGILILSSYAVITRQKDKLSTTAMWMPVMVLPLLGLGLGALFLDLEYKAHVFRFFTTFEITAPMSWGSWILGFVQVTSLLVTVHVLYQLEWFKRLPFGKLNVWKHMSEFVGRHELGLAKTNLVLGIALGIYTGILLSAFAARPLWNSSMLGMVFLASGLSSGAALAALVSHRYGTRSERDWLVRIDLACIAAEMLFIGLWIIGLLTGSEAGREAANLILGGPYTAAFWSLVIVVGLLLPGLLEWMALRSRWSSHLVAPMLVLIGGIALRFIVVNAGQISAATQALGN